MIVKINGLSIVPEMPAPVKVIDFAAEAGKWAHDVHEKGFWIATTGKQFGPWAVQELSEFWNWIVQYSDILVAPAIILGLLAMCGSAKSKKYLYWNVVVFMILKASKFYMGI